MKDIINIGYWKFKSRESNPLKDMFKDDPRNSCLPEPIENSATPEQTQKQLAIFKAFVSKASPVSYRGFSGCRLCGKTNGNKEYEFEGIGIPEGLEHYITDHNVLVPGLLEINL